MTDGAPGVEVVVDVVMLAVRHDALVARVRRRDVPPFLDRWELPGAGVLTDEDLEVTARRAMEHGGVEGPSVHLEQLATFAAPRRDPRGRVVSVVHLALVGDPSAARPVVDVEWVPVEDVEGRTAFDHGAMLADGVERLRAKLEYTPLAGMLCHGSFTIAELRRVYDAVWDVTLDARNFHRKATTTPGFIRASGGVTNRDGGRPAQLFEAGEAQVLHPPMVRPSTKRGPSVSPRAAG